MRGREWTGSGDPGGYLGGGDPACWLDRVCADCGRFRDDPSLPTCARCGARFAEPRDDGPGGDPLAASRCAPPAEPRRDRDPAGRARNARPRDGLGRPLPYGAPGVERAPEGVRRAPDDALAEAQRLLDAGMPFHAHEVLEDAWKLAAEPERALWRGLAQLAVGLTHAARGNPAGAGALLRRAAESVAPYRDEPPHGIDVAGLLDWATSRAAELDTAEPDTAELDSAAGAGIGVPRLAANQAGTS